MRVFIAIPLSKECQAMLENLQQQLRTCRADVRWTAISSIHLTLKFLGEIDPAIIPEMAESLRATSKADRSFTLQLHGLGAFPNFKVPRIIWCGIHGDTDGLARLQERIEGVCADFGFPPEARAFHPHLTLGRVKGKRNLQHLLDCIKIDSDLRSAFTVDCFSMYRSILKPQGAEYSIVETVALARTD